MNNALSRSIRTCSTIAVGRDLARKLIGYLHSGSPGPLAQEVAERSDRPGPAELGRGLQRCTAIYEISFRNRPGLIDGGNESLPESCSPIFILQHRHDRSAIRPRS